MDEQQNLTTCKRCGEEYDTFHTCSAPATPPQHSDEWLDEALDWSSKALMASMLPNILEGQKTIPIDQEFLDRFRLEAKQAILAELKNNYVRKDDFVAIGRLHSQECSSQYVGSPCNCKPYTEAELKKREDAAREDELNNFLAVESGGDTDLDGRQTVPSIGLPEWAIMLGEQRLAQLHKEQQS